MTRRIVLPILLAVLAAGFAATLPSAAIGHAVGGGRIVFDHTVFGGAEDILTIRSDGSDADNLTNNPGTTGSELPAWAPDGEQVYFDSDRAGNVHLFTVDTDRDGLIHQVTATDGFEASAGPSPDGRRVAFEHETSDFSSGGIFSAPARPGEAEPFRQITASPALPTGGFDTNPSFSPDGRRIAFTRVLSTEAPTARSAIFVVDANGRHPTQLTAYSLNAGFPHWSPDGEHLLFSSNIDNFSATLSANIFLMCADGTRLTQVTHDTGGDQSFTPAWSPDGGRIVFAHATAGENHTDLDIINLTTHATSVIWHGSDGTQDQDPAWQPRSRPGELSGPGWAVSGSRTPVGSWAGCAMATRPGWCRSSTDRRGSRSGRSRRGCTP